MNQFGCDTATKQCKCNVVKRERQFCTTNDECRIQGRDNPAICALVSDFTTGESFGSMECQDCSTTTPVCHILDTNSRVGVCSCMQSRVLISGCEGSSLGADVFPNPADLCGVNLDRGARSTTNFYYDWSRLATAPCALINPSQAWCYDTGSEQGYVVVGNSLIETGLIPTFGSGRRRLFGFGGSSNQTTTTTTPPPKKEPHVETTRERFERPTGPHRGPRGS